MKNQNFFPKVSALLLAGATAASLLAVPASRAQVVTGNTTTTTDSQGKPDTNVSLSIDTSKKKKVAKDDRVQQTKDTRAEAKKVAKFNPLEAQDAQLPDKQLYDKSLAQEKAGHFDVARLDLQTLLNTYPDSEYQMRAKLAVADSWYREGGTAALAQAEQEYKDFITFFPNAPEAAEAQMRVGDIYFKQMDVPDRDYTKAVSAENEYRTMLKQYPDAPPAILKEAKQKLREVQEVLAARESEIALFYSTHENWAATIARYKTVVDTYPYYSHLDDTLIGLGDAYEAQAKQIRSNLRMPEAARGKLLQEDEGKAADYYRTVVLEHSAAPHAEDAKERLLSMGLTVPQPTPDQAAASELLEGSRAQYTMRSRLELMFLHKPDTVTAAQMGEPSLDDPAATTAPQVIKESVAQFQAAVNPNAVLTPVIKPSATTSDADAPAPDAATPAPAGAPMLSDVPTTGSGQSGSVSEMTTAAPSGAGGTGIGMEVLTPGVNGGSAPPSNLPAATGAPDPNYGLTSVAPKDSTPLPAAEKPADAPDQVNEAAGKPQPATQTTAPGDKKTKTPYDKDDESSSKKKPKKGVDKLNPF